MTGKSTTIKSEFKYLLLHICQRLTWGVDFQMAYAQQSWADERESWNAVVLLNLVRSVNAVIDVLNETLDNALLLYSDQSPSHEQQLTPLTEQHRNAIKRLGVLRQIEKDLKVYLGSGASETEENDAVQGEEQSQRHHEFVIRSSSGWKGILDKIRNPANGKDHNNAYRKALQVVTSCSQDISWIWKNSATQFVLKSRQINIEDSPGL